MTCVLWFPPFDCMYCFLPFWVEFRVRVGFCELCFVIFMIDHDFEGDWQLWNLGALIKVSVNWVFLLVEFEWLMLLC